MTTFGPYVASVAKIHDGDTISVDALLHASRGPKTEIDLGFNLRLRKGGLWLVGQNVRLFGCNAPELATPEGKAALAFIRTLVAVGDPVSLLSHGWDKYGGRIDGLVLLPDGRDLAREMIAAGHAKFWDGVGPKPV